MGPEPEAALLVKLGTGRWGPRPAEWGAAWLGGRQAGRTRERTQAGRHMHTLRRQPPVTHCRVHPRGFPGTLLSTGMEGWARHSPCPSSWEWGLGGRQGDTCAVGGV